MSLSGKTTSNPRTIFRAHKVKFWYLFKILAIAEQSNTSLSLNKMTLQIKLEDSNCRPGQLLNGTVVWQFDSTPTKLTLEVSWQTSGKGTDDSETIFTEDWSPGSNSGEKKFQFQLPRGPISVHGNLIAIEWQVECTSIRPQATSVMPFVLSHLDQPIRLSPVDAIPFSL